MEWWEKEYAYETKWQNGTVAKDLWKYIPKRLEEAVDETAVDSDGYWIYLNEGWNEDGERTIHVYTVTDLKEAINGIVKGDGNE